jgi:predicted nucleotidyltransferase/uncharacterized protein (UPF0332 family)
MEHIEFRNKNIKMDFEQKKKLKDNQINYHIENLKISREFSKTLILELKDLVRSIVIFGSNTQNTLNKDSDIDIMVVLDNISVFVSPELKEAYQIIINNISQKYPNKLHILTMNLSDLWDNSRKGDPVLINILRYGQPLFDRDLIEPMQYLLETGKIRPTREAAFNYISRSENLLEETDKHLQNAILDLYYSTIDIVHATLMTHKIMPPSPRDMPKIFEKEFKKTNFEKYSKDIEELYILAKDIEHNRIEKINGKLFDKYKKVTTKLVTELKKYSKDKIQKSDIFEF